jgi:DNA helicase-2/ATP-dependent DNA helicase PcrA
LPLSQLNEDQYSAATTELGHNLIIASAGTGKTSTIVARIAHLLQSGTDASEILLLTFTNKAASEMIERVGRYFPEEAKQIEAGTFHAVSYRYLKSQGRPVSLKQPRELKTLLKSIYDKRQFFHIESENKPYLPAYLYDLYSLFRNSSELDADFGDFIKAQNPAHANYIDIYSDIIAEYEQTKSKYGYINFDDLLVETRNSLLLTPTHYQEILVDEYQDTNPLQNSLINAYSKNSLFCVGDYDQSIYAFNGSDINIIGGFDENYKDAKVYTLRKNYRSTKKILSLANRVIQNNPRIYPKELEVVRDGEAIPPKLLGFDELYDQYAEIAFRISMSTTPHEEIAVIFRNNSAADGIEASLREHNIKAKRKGSTSFFDSREVKVLLDLLSILNNPKDMMSFIHVFEYVKGVGSSIAKDIHEALSNLGGGDILQGLHHPKNILNPFSKRVKNFQLGLFDDFYELGSIGKFKALGFEEEFLSNPVLKHPKINEDAGVFLHEIYLLYKRLKRVKSPYKMLQIIEESKVFAYIKDDLSTKRSVGKDGQVNDDLKEESLGRIDYKAKLLRDLAGHYEELGRFLNAMILGGSEITQSEGVNLLTVHASKGLEFEEVYVVDLMEGRFPNRTLISKGGSLEEERRLFYVAATRAKEKLYLSYAGYDRVRKTDYVPCTFLYEAGMISKPSED